MGKFEELYESIVKNYKRYMYNNINPYTIRMGRLKRDITISTGSSTQYPIRVKKIYQLKKGDIINVDVANDGTTWIEAGIFPSENNDKFKYIVRGKPYGRFDRNNEVKYLKIKTLEDLENEREIPFKEENYEPIEEK